LAAKQPNVGSKTGSWPPSADELRAAFDGGSPYAVGLEDEVMLLDPESLELVPLAREMMGLLAGDARFKLELPASQLEIVTPPFATVQEAAAALSAARRTLAQRTSEHVCLAACGVHPFSSGVGELNPLPRYAHTQREYAPVAARQLEHTVIERVKAGQGDELKRIAHRRQLAEHLQHLQPALAVEAGQRLDDHALTQQCAFRCRSVRGCALPISTMVASSPSLSMIEARSSPVGLLI